MMLNDKRRGTTTASGPSLEEDLARLLHIMGSAAQSKSSAILNTEFEPEIQTMVRRHGGSQVMKQAVAMWERRGELGVMDREALLLTLTSRLTPHVLKKDAVKLLAPYVPDLVQEVKDRYPKTQLFLRVCRWISPKSIPFDQAKEDWSKAVRRVQRELEAALLRTTTIARDYHLISDGGFALDDFMRTSGGLGNSTGGGRHTHPPAAVSSPLLAALRVEMPIVTFLGDSGVALDAMASYLLHPFLGGGGGVTTPGGAAVATPHSAISKSTGRRGQQEGGGAAAAGGVSFFEESSFQAAAARFEARKRSSRGSSRSFRVFVYSDEPCEWNMETFLNFTGHPFSALLKGLLLGVGHGGSSGGRTTMIGVGLPHPLLRSMLVVVTPPLQDTCPATTSLFLQIMELVLKVSDRCYVVGDGAPLATSAAGNRGGGGEYEAPLPRSSSCLGGGVSEEMHAVLSGATDWVTEGKMQFLWDLGPQAAIEPTRTSYEFPSLGALQALGAFAFHLHRILNVPQVPYIYQVSTSCPQLQPREHYASGGGRMAPQRSESGGAGMHSHGDGFAFLFDLTEQLPMTFLDRRIGMASRVLRDYFIQVRVLCRVFRSSRSGGDAADASGGEVSLKKKGMQLKSQSQSSAAVVLELSSAWTATALQQLVEKEILPELYRAEREQRRVFKAGERPLTQKDRADLKKMAAADAQHKIKTGAKGKKEGDDEGRGMFLENTMPNVDFLYNENYIQHLAHLRDFFQAQYNEALEDQNNKSWTNWFLRKHSSTSEPEDGRRRDEGGATTVVGLSPPMQRDLDWLDSELTVHLPGLLNTLKACEDPMVDRLTRTVVQLNQLLEDGQQLATEAEEEKSSRRREQVQLQLQWSNPSLSLKTVAPPQANPQQATPSEVDTHSPQLALASQQSAAAKEEDSRRVDLYQPRVEAIPVSIDPPTTTTATAAAAAVLSIDHNTVSFEQTPRTAPRRPAGHRRSQSHQVLGSNEFQQVRDFTIAAMKTALEGGGCRSPSHSTLPSTEEIALEAANLLINLSTLEGEEQFGRRSVLDTEDVEWNRCLEVGVCDGATPSVSSTFRRGRKQKVDVEKRAIVVPSQRRVKGQSADVAGVLVHPKKEKEEEAYAPQEGKSMVPTIRNANLRRPVTVLDHIPRKIEGKGVPLLSTSGTSSVPPGKTFGEANDEMNASSPHEHVTSTTTAVSSHPHASPSFGLDSDSDSGISFDLDATIEFGTGTDAESPAPIRSTLKRSGGRSARESERIVRNDPSLFPPPPSSRPVVGVNAEKRATSRIGLPPPPSSRPPPKKKGHARTHTVS